jgi:hypothetical protein
MPTVERDRIYLEDMIMHHEAAIVTAKQVLELSIHPEVEQLANNIIMTQETEIGAHEGIASTASRINYLRRQDMCGWVVPYNYFVYFEYLPGAIML